MPEWNRHISPVEAFGNDLVWLDDPENVGRSSDQRLLQRILTPAERLLVSVSREPDFTLWSLWAAKEAAFKAWSRAKPGAVFSASAFVVEFLTREGRALVRRGGWNIGVTWTRGSGWVHALACEHPDNVVLEVRPLAAGTAESLGVRALAKEILVRQGFAEGDIEGKPPVYRIASTGQRVELSLSHDGPFLAAVVPSHP